MFFRKKSPNPAEDSTSLGCVLVHMGAVTQVDLEACLRVQESRRDKMLGDLLVARGLVTEEVLHLALIRQLELRKKRVDYAAATTKILDGMRHQVNETATAIHSMSEQMREFAQKLR